MDEQTSRPADAVTPASRVGFDLADVAAARGSSTAIREGARRVGYDDLERLATAVAAGLHARGVAPGDRVFLLTCSAIDTFAVLAGAARLGAVTVPGSWRLSPTELAGVLADCDPVVALVDPDMAAAVEASQTRPPVVVLEPGVLDSWAGGPAAPVEGTLPAPGTVLQVYTSGTTGAPKGVLLTAANLTCKVQRMAQEWGLGPRSTSLLTTPLFHVGGLSWGLVALSAGATVVAPPRRSGLAATVAEHGVTHAFLVPTMVTDLLTTLDGTGQRLDTLEVLVCGAAPVSVALQERVAATLGCRLLQVYGLTETTGTITQLDAAEATSSNDPATVLASSGRPYPWVDVEVRDPVTATPVPPGAFGEVWTRSAQSCAGYWGRPAQTADLLVDGWLRTGDGGFLDEEGRLHLTDRIKDMIVSGGENIYSIEVERALQTHPSVRDVAVVGCPDPTWGEVVTAVVEPHPGRTLHLDEAAEHVAAHLGRYKRPRHLLLVDDLPRNDNGKILKRDVRRLVADQLRREPS